MAKLLFSRKNKEDKAANGDLSGVLANVTDDAFIVLSEDNFEVEYVSPNVERVLGISVKDIERNVGRLAKAKYRDDKAVTKEQLMQMGVGSSFTVVAEREHWRSKERRFYNDTVYKVSAGGAIKFVVVISDCTKELLARQSLEEALSIAKEANRAKGTFLANMSHDIRTPMNTIVGLCTLLQRDIDDKEKLDAHIKHIQLTSRHMLTLINDILDMSKIEAGETTLNIAEINLAALVKEIEAQISPLATAKGQTLKTIVGVKEGSFLGDKLRIKRVMTNILSNAVRYTPDGGKIEFTVQQMSRPSLKYVYLQFIVKDNGVGMSEEFLGKIFEPFTRELAVAEVQGTGLGMPIAKNLVELMGGTIAVESKVGVGSKFTVSFKFPLSKVSDTQFWVEHGVTRVLVVGGNDIDNKSISWAMRKSEVTVNFAKTAKAALSSIEKALLEGKGYNLVICNWNCGGRNPLPTVNELRKELPEYVPLVAFGEEWNEIEEEATEAGISVFMVKPFLLTAFKECVVNIKDKGRGNSAPDKSVLCGKRFIAAEDNELNSMVLCELLNMVGATCVVKSNGKEAVEEFEKSTEGQYDGILMDVQMPVMDGYEATRAIRASEHPEARSIPIIAMTANAFAEDIKNSHEAGMDAYLLKPIDMIKLEETFVNLKK
ncbi:MAG: response regulator [Clostridia bacterium]|nr:response regulator [Clostridia bacterium]